MFESEILKENNILNKNEEEKKEKSSKSAVKNERIKTIQEIYYS
jgi:hypothetical protein